MSSLLQSITKKVHVVNITLKLTGEKYAATDKLVNTLTDIIPIFLVEQQSYGIE